MQTEPRDPKTQADVDRSSIYIRNFNSEITLAKLEEHFSEELGKTGGSILRLTVVERKKKNVPAFAYLEFDSETTRDHILQLNHTSIGDHLFSFSAKRTNVPEHMRAQCEPQPNKGSRAGKHGHSASRFLFHISASTKKSK
ncbi:hypothetical protein ACO0QE_000172 [Hanseniaspora vineae]